MNPGFSRNAFTDARIAPRLRPLKDDLVGDIGKTLWVLMGTVGIVLLIACANVANLLLVRADGRRQELAIRAALGAGWGRIARELLLESALLGVAGGALGLALAYGALRVLVASELAHLPRIHEISIDPAVLAFTLGVSLAAGLLFGLIPVFKYARPHVSHGAARRRTVTHRSKERHRARSVLVVVQVALALVLLVGSGLMIRTFRALRHVDPGFSGAAELETLRIVDSARRRCKEPERVIRMEEEILRKIEALPGVSAVAMTSALPLEGGSNDPVYVEDQSVPRGQHSSDTPLQVHFARLHLRDRQPPDCGARPDLDRDYTTRRRWRWSRRTWRASSGAIRARRSASASAPGSKTTGGK